MSSHISALEALLFIHGEPIRRDTIVRVLGIQDSELDALLNSFRDELSRADRGLSLLEHRGGYALVTKSEYASVVEAFIKEGLKEDLTPAAVETLSLIAYFGPIARAQIDYVRGVNSSFILRALLVRGLIERTPKGNAYEYRVSIDFLKHMGVTRIEDLPDYSEYQIMKDKLFAFDENQEAVVTTHAAQPESVEEPDSHDPLS